ncbi:MAG: LysR substrate-binding domain-containing protein [Pseudomonadota bacterium]
MRRLPPLATLPAFEATARLGSVSAAARELGRTHGAISKQIRSLSDDVGGDLFQKQGTGLKLTERGERLRRLLTPVLDDLEAAAQGLRLEVDDRHVDVAASATLAMRWLTPRLPAFYARHPDVDIRLHMSGPKRVRDQEIDVVLSYDRLRGSLKHPDKHALGDAAYGPVCAPDYRIERNDRVATVEARLTQPSAARIWQAWEELSGLQLAAAREVEHPHHFLAIEAASAGLGLAMAEKRIVAADLSAGRLIAPLGFVTVKDGFQAAVMPRAAKRRSAAALLAWLAEAAREDQG